MSLKDCAEQASREVQDTFKLSLSSEDADKLSAIIERAIVEAVRMSCESSTKAASSVLDASGYVVARRQATVSSKVTGKVLEVLVEEGMSVEKDQIVATLDDTTQQAQLAVAIAQADSSRAALAEIGAQLRNARQELERVREQDAGPVRVIRVARPVLGLLMRVELEPCAASGSCPSRLQPGHACPDTPSRTARVISTVTMPVGTAMIPYPRIMIVAARAWPTLVCGEMSP